MNSPDSQQQLDAAFQNYWAQWDIKRAEAAQWGFPISLEEFEKSPQGKARYPFIDLKLVTEAGYSKLLTDQQTARRNTNTEYQRKKRAKLRKLKDGDFPGGDFQS